MDRRIIHVDMDEFFAAVEKLDHPELRGKCLLIGGDPKARGVVSTASYEAREYGCHSAMPMAQAVRLCPHAIVLPGNMSRYAEISEQLGEIFLRFTPLVEPISIDEAFLDVTGSRRLLGAAEDIGWAIKRTIADELHLTASVGVAPNKFLAKLASDLHKPDGFTVITETNIHQTLDPLPVRKLWGVGPALEGELLRRLNIKTIGQLRLIDTELLVQHFGQGGCELQELAAGVDDRPVTPDSAAKSISQEVTFAQDLSDRAEMRSVTLAHVETVARRLRRSGMLARTVTLKLRYGDFTTLTRRLTMDEPTDVTAEIRATATKLLDAWAAKDFRPLRLLGMGVAGLSPKAGSQQKLFVEPQREKQSKVDLALDTIARRFGSGALRRGPKARDDE
ncbi:MAG: DNA polymerase IV [Planctomycetaceae bacterium]|nr:DNA polymerase IV [Planctomycetaceae bacterium]